MQTRYLDSVGQKRRVFPAYVLTACLPMALLSAKSVAQGLPPNTGSKADRIAAALKYAKDTGAIRLIARVKPPREGAAAGPPTLAAVSAASTQVLLALAASPESVPETHSLNPSLVSITATQTGVEQLANNPAIEDVYIDELADPLLMYSVPAIEATTLHKQGVTGAGFTIAILDTGIDGTHPALKGKIISEACFSTTIKTAGSQSLCPNGDSSSTAPGSGAPCPNLLIGCEHGTHVAGIVASAPSKFNNADIEGVAPGASIISIQVFSKLSGENLCGAGIVSCIKSWQSDQIAALRKVLELSPSFKIAAVNMSLGASDLYTAPCDTSTIKENIDVLRQRGILTVVAAGNSPYKPGLTSPACVSSAISVGASDGITSIATAISSRATYLTLVAPGVQIHSTWPMSMGGGYRPMDGTSMAAPHVAGTLALLRSKFPKASADQLQTALTVGAPMLTDPMTNIAYARLDARVAMANLNGNHAASPPAAVNHEPGLASNPSSPGPSESVNRFIATLPTSGRIKKPSDVLTPGERQRIEEETKLSDRQFSITLPQELADKLKTKMAIQKNELASPLESIPTPPTKN